MHILNNKIVSDSHSTKIAPDRKIILIIEDYETINLNYKAWGKEITEVAPHIEIKIITKVDDALSFYKKNIDHIKTVVVDDTLSKDDAEVGPQITRAILDDKIEQIRSKNTREHYENNYETIHNKIKNNEALSQQERTLIGESITILANSSSHDRNAEIIKAGAKGQKHPGKSFYETMRELLNELSAESPN